MATKLDTYVFPGAGRKASFDYNSILDGSIWQLENGVDFDMSPQSFRNSVSRAAKWKGQFIRTSITGNVIVVQAYDRPKP